MTVFVTLLCTAVETAISEVHKFLQTGRVPTSLILLFWRWLMVSSVFAGQSHVFPFSSLISLTVFVDVKHNVYLLKAHVRAQQLYKSPGGRPELPVSNKSYGFYGRKAPRKKKAHILSSPPPPPPPRVPVQKRPFCFLLLPAHVVIPLLESLHQFLVG